jgi:16S rRNA (cytosine967-C5)-methyltransferase
LAERAAGARALAVDLLTRVERDRAYASLLLDATLARRALDPREAALLTELTYGVLRWRATLDWLLETVGRRRIADLPVRLRQILRVGAYQLRFLDRVPAYAAVSEAVAAAKGPGGHEGWASLANALLRRLAERRESLPVPDMADATERLALAFSHPPWLVRRWLARFGEAEATVLLQAEQRPAPTVLLVNRLRADVPSVAARLAADGVAATASPLLPEALRVREGASVRHHPLVAEGKVQVMDEGAALAVALLDPQPGETVLDACAGGGNKAARTAALMGNVGRIVALDVSERARRRLHEACTRLGATIVEPKAGDAREASRHVAGGADRVLVDAPCTGLGTLRRHPEIRWRVREADLARLAALQRELLRGAAEAVRPGGVLVYAVCSPEPEEGEAVATAFSGAARAFQEEAPVGFPAGACTRLPEGGFRTFPHREGCDGFYFIRWRRGVR